MVTRAQGGEGEEWCGNGEADLTEPSLGEDGWGHALLDRAQDEQGMLVTPQRSAAAYE